MSTPEVAAGPVAEVPPGKRIAISLDTWAVLLSLALAALVRAGILKSVPW